MPALDLPARNITPDAKLGYIDAVRGWAIILVMTAHAGGRFADLPYPVKKLTNFGWHGVQLFFLASALTLMMSWSRRRDPWMLSTKKFFVRRFLRIAPMYYLGGVLYFFFDPPTSGFDIAQVLRAAFFINAWHPTWIALGDGWKVVPGGWSIGVEFTFYMIFPALASMVTTTSRAWALVIVSFVMALSLNMATAHTWQLYGPLVAEEFMYFWFPNQFPVFAAGILLYHILERTKAVAPTRLIKNCILVCLIMACVITAELPTSPTYFSFKLPPPPIFFATLIFIVFIFMLTRHGQTVFTHRVIQWIGTHSFSAYVLHFLFVGHLPSWSGGLINIHASGYTAILNLALLWVCVMVATFATAYFTHLCIEQPGINLAHRLSRST